MYIKSLKLENFQKHSNLKIDFKNGVNILYGSSDAGKSCIRRAIEWITQNESIDGIRKTGTKKTSVSITLDNNVEVERIRSQSINRYIIRKDEDEKIYDAVGKSIPDEVKEVLTIYPIEIDGEEIYLNSYPQIGLPFLFDKSPSFRMKLFNKLTGNDVLDKLFSEFNKDILRIKRNLKEETQQSEEREVLLKSKKTEMEKAEVIHKKLKKRLENIKKLNEKYSKLVELKDLQQKNIEVSEETTKTLKSLKFPQPEVIQQLTEKINRFDILLTHRNSSEKVEIGLNRVTKQLKDLKPIVVNLSELRGKIDRFGKILTISDFMADKKGFIQTIEKDLKIIVKDIEYNNKELKKFKICPQCEGKGLIKNEEVKL